MCFRRQLCIKNIFSFHLPLLHMFLQNDIFYNLKTLTCEHCNNYPSSLLVYKIGLITRTSRLLLKSLSKYSCRYCGVDMVVCQFKKHLHPRGSVPLLVCIFISLAHCIDDGFAIDDTIHYSVVSYANTILFFACQFYALHGACEYMLHNMQQPALVLLVHFLQ